MAFVKFETILLVVLVTIPSYISQIEAVPRISQHNAGKLLRCSAASKGQIQEAEKMKYDDTGPGAKGPEFAYKTFKYLDDALVNYIADSDTKLPEEERNIAYVKLMSRPKFEVKFIDRSKFNNPRDMKWHEVTENGSEQKVRQLPVPKQVKSDLTVKDFPWVSHYLTKHVRGREDYPRYSFSYGVNDHFTGDNKRVHEVRDGDSVKGYYTFMDADGKRRIVWYTVDDYNGFKAQVLRQKRSVE